RRAAGPAPGGPQQPRRDGSRGPGVAALRAALQWRGGAGPGPVQDGRQQPLHPGPGAAPRPAGARPGLLRPGMRSAGSIFGGGSPRRGAMRDHGDATTVRPDLEGMAAGERRPPEDRGGERAEAFLERHRRGERPSVEEYATAHPELAGEIRRLFPALLMMEELGPAASDLTGGHPAARGTAPERLGDYR